MLQCATKGWRLASAAFHFCGGIDAAAAAPLPEACSGAVPSGGPRSLARQDIAHEEQRVRQGGEQGLCSRGVVAVPGKFRDQGCLVRHPCLAFGDVALGHFQQ